MDALNSPDPDGVARPVLAVDRERSYEARSGVPYVSEWARAKAAAAALADTLHRLGLAPEFGDLRPDVNVFGDALVRLDWTTADAVLAFARAVFAGTRVVFAGICAEKLRTADDRPGPTGPHGNAPERSSPAA